MIPQSDMTPCALRANSSELIQGKTLPTSYLDEMIPVFRHNQDLLSDTDIAAPIWWCKKERDHGRGDFVHRGGAFRMAKPKATTETKPKTDAQNKLPVNWSTVRGVSNQVDEPVMIAFCEGEPWAIEILRSWRQRLRRYRRQELSASRKRIRKERRAQRAEGIPNVTPSSARAE